MKSRGILTTIAVALAITFISPVNVKAEESKSPLLPNIVGKAAVTLDYETGEIIYYKEGDAKKYPASTTKLMTALVFAENAKKSDTIPYNEDAKRQPEYSLNINFKPIALTDSMSGEDVMKALMMYSANDSAYMIADYIGKGDYKTFVDMMNKKAKSLNLNNTHFVNPNGLHDDNHYTTAYDLSVIAREAYKNDWVREVMTTDKAKIQISNGTIINLENRNKQLNHEGNIGGKTGYTTQAGRCLAAIYERNGRKLLGVVLQSEYDANDTTVFEDMKKIMDYSFEAQKITYLKAGTVVGKTTVSYKPLKFFGPDKKIEVPITLTEDVTYYDNIVNRSEIKTSVDTPNIDAWQLAKNNSTLKLTVSERVYSKQYGLTADISTSKLVKENLALYATVIGSVVATLVVISAIFSLFRKVSRGRRRKRNIF